jgi:hypothetical protein
MILELFITPFQIGTTNILTLLSPTHGPNIYKETMP